MAKFKATEKYIEDAADLAHFSLEAPQWVDWSEFDEGITGYMTLFGRDPDVWDESTITTTGKQLNAAIGWDGTEFDSLNDSSHVGKKVLFRIETDEYQGEVKLRVNWIDAPDANPTRELRKLDSAKISEINKKLKMTKKAKPTAAKPGAAKAQVAKPAAAPAPAPAPAPAAAAAPPATTPPSAPPAAAPQEAAPVAEETAQGPALPAKVTKADAWTFICAHKAESVSAADLEESWIQSCGQVFEATGRDDDKFTPEDWASVIAGVAEQIPLVSA